MATPAAGAPSAGAPRPAPRAPGRIGTEEYHSAPLPPAQEAAVLYAANLVAPAEAILKAETRNPASRSNKQPWLMLFDLFEVTQNRAEYDALSLLFTVKFEQSPPAVGRRGRGGLGPAAHAEPRAQGLLRPEAEHGRASSGRRSRSSWRSRSPWGRCGSTSARSPRSRPPSRPCSPRRCSACAAPTSRCGSTTRNPSSACCAPRSTSAPRKPRAASGCCSSSSWCCRASRSPSRSSGSSTPSPSRCRPPSGRCT